MNPSYSSGSSDSSVNTPGVKPGVIASGPDPADVPAPQPLSTPSPAMTPRKKLRLPTGGRSGSIPTIGGSSRGGSKKGLIIGALVAIVILIVVLVVVLLMNGNKKNNGNTTDDSNYGNFLIYANYLLDGTESSKNDIGDFNKSKEYTVTKEYAENNSGFFTKTQELWNSFYEKIKSDEKYSETSKMMGDVEYQNELTDFATKYMTTTNLDNTALLNLYTKNGADKAKAQVDENYETLLSTVFEPGKDYVTTLVDYANKTISLYSVYDSYGCIKDGEIDDACLKSNSEKIAPASSQYILELPEVDNTIIEDVIDELIDFCFRIKNDFGESNE
ncbi:hypothetical protein IJI86_01355 [Candidatus Saccharibacteria bacterium]|nr:hypothetical protein [Candidatus Saccharibacteria bacterium]